MDREKLKRRNELADMIQQMGAVQARLESIVGFKNLVRLLNDFLYHDDAEQLGHIISPIIKKWVEDRLAVLIREFDEL